MKKTISFAAVVLVLLSLFSFAASAGDAEFRESMQKAVVGENGDYILYKGEKFLYADWMKNFDMLKSESSSSWVESSYSGERYVYFDVCEFGDCDYLLNADYRMNDSTNAYYNRYFVREDYYSKLSQYADFTVAEEFATVSDYNFTLDITAAELNAWLSPKMVYEVPADTINGYDRHWFYNRDSDGFVYFQMGLILHNTADGEFYLIYFPEYERNCFYGDGSFAFESDVTAKLYVLDDPSLKSRLEEVYSRLPDDELDWIVNDENSSNLKLIVMSVFLFGLLPLALIIWSALMLVRKVRRPYKAGFAALAISSAVTIACFIAILIIL